MKSIVYIEVSPADFLEHYRLSSDGLTLQAFADEFFSAPNKQEFITEWASREYKTSVKRQEFDPGIFITQKSHLSEYLVSELEMEEDMRGAGS